MSIKIKKISELPDYDGNLSDFWTIGTHVRDDGTLESIRYNLMAVVEKLKDIVQLERRISLYLERAEQLIPLGERMTLYAVKAGNVSRLEVKKEGAAQWTDIPLDGRDFSVLLDGTATGNAPVNYIFRATAANDTEPCSVYLMARLFVADN